MKKMPYNFRYPTEWEDGILISCNECKLEIFRCIDENKQFSFNSNERLFALQFIINTLNTAYPDYYNYPKKTKSKVTDLLVSHGQFLQDEIDSIYKSKEFRDFVLEWEEELLNQGFSLSDISEYIVFGSNDGKIEHPINYSWGFIPCSTIMEVGLCRQNVEKFICPYCDGEIYNNPEYLDSFNNIVCLDCKKIVIRSNIPYHHGEWFNGEPSIEKVSRDYLAIYHPNCGNTDENGEMYPTGIWVEDRRLIINFKCNKCGYEDVLKFFVKDNSIINRIFTTPKSKSRKYNQLKEVRFRTYKLLEETESKNLEFKSSFYGLNPNAPPTKKSIKNAKIQIANEIMGFLNSEGGTLIIGIEKNNIICGIEEDFNYVMENKKGLLLPPDFYLQEINELLKYEISNSQIVFPNINISLENLPTGECVCIIDVKKSKNPVFTRNNEFIVNIGGSKQKFTGDAIKEYIREHFGQESIDKNE